MHVLVFKKKARNTHSILALYPGATHGDGTWDQLSKVFGITERERDRRRPGSEYFRNVAGAKGQFQIQTAACLKGIARVNIQSKAFMGEWNDEDCSKDRKHPYVRAPKYNA